MQQIPFLSEEDVSQHLGFAKLIDAMANALSAYSAGEIVQPDRQMLPVQPAGGFFGAMPAVGSALGLKTVAFFPANSELNLPTHHALIQLFDPKTGVPMVVMDGRLITEMRTAAVSAAFLRSVITGKEKVLTIFGNGLQAEAHMEALSHVHTFEEVRVWSRNPDKAQKFASTIGAKAMDAAEAVDGADVVITATAAKEPVLQGAWLKPGALVAAVGWNSKDGRELDEEAMGNTVIVESRSGTSKESGNVRHSGAEIYAEAGEIISGSKTIEPGSTVIFDSIGMACEDVFAANLVWQKYSQASS